MRYDVAIVGAGPAGAATAIHLAREGLRVVVVDRCVFPRDKPCAEYLSPAAEPLLAQLGIADLLDEARSHRLRGFRIYAPGGRVFQGDFAATRGPNGASLFETGLVIPRSRLDAAILTGARRAGAEAREGWRLGQMERLPDGWRLHPVIGAAQEREPIEARLLVAADGLRSTVARRLGLHRDSRMRKIALVAHMRGIADVGAYGEMHVAGRRYVGVAPLEPPERGGLCNVAMVVDEARDGRSLAGKPEAFLLDALRTFPGLRDRLGPLVVERHTLTTSRLNVRARRLSDAHLLLVGDATGYYDPFTGEGIYRALAGAEMAARVALPALAANDLSAARLLAYDRAQRQAFRGKRLIEEIIQTAVQHPSLMDHIARTLSRRKAMADTIVAVTGDFLPASAVLRPGYLLRLVV
ncbi:MAG TPA: FAD-dependent oxidoreductase [Ktedonobacterales bacterium]|jgi:flavin-dependent dehydrogenase|nr:FAD-dependent oxidoreductase [Ktedonobacterales bacterium]